MKPDAPILSEQQTQLLKSLGIEWKYTDVAVILTHPDQSITRLDAATFPIWMNGYLEGKAAGIRLARNIINS